MVNICRLGLPGPLPPPCLTRASTQSTLAKASAASAASAAGTGRAGRDRQGQQGQARERCDRQDQQDKQRNRFNSGEVAESRTDVIGLLYRELQMPSTASQRLGAMQRTVGTVHLE